MQAIDTNVLVYAEITSSQHHRQAHQLLTQLTEGAVPWALPWPCIYEFLRVVTHPRVFHPPVPLEIAVADLKAITDSPSILLLSETDRHLELMTSLAKEAGVYGNLIHDAHIAALCLEHGVTELISADRDFLRFKSLKIINPFQ
ncbi:MAG TPA: TA system VapC family ribonuclease toxin [Candidatus Binatia bacterium]|nr:TA system VapC family ribonuclease toxin [Candidatus Binatia bacterium]